MSIEKLCKAAGVSRGGFYYWLNKEEPCPDKVFEEELIEDVFRAKLGKTGARGIRMILNRSFWITMNLKKVRRVMKERDLVCKIRRKNKYNSQPKSSPNKEIPNLLDQQFDSFVPGEALSSDITMISYGKDLRAYLSATKDIGGKDIVHFNVSKNVTMPIVMKGLAEYLDTIPLEARKNLIIHTDQGGHYTSPIYRNLLKEKQVIQSMSRRGNCLDNAPIESFFGHLKDEVDLKNIKTYEELEKEIDLYMKYYNNSRPQWALNGKTPAEHRGLTCSPFH